MNSHPLVLIYSSFPAEYISHRKSLSKVLFWFSWLRLLSHLRRIVYLHVVRKHLVLSHLLGNTLSFKKSHCIWLHLHSTFYIKMTLLLINETPKFWVLPKGYTQGKQLLGFMGKTQLNYFEEGEMQISYFLSFPNLLSWTPKNPFSHPLLVHLLQVKSKTFSALYDIFKLITSLYLNFLIYKIGVIHCICFIGLWGLNTRGVSESVPCKNLPNKYWLNSYHHYHHHH